MSSTTIPSCSLFSCGAAPRIGNTAYMVVDGGILIEEYTLTTSVVVKRCEVVHSSLRGEVRCEWRIEDADGGGEYAYRFVFVPFGAVCTTDDGSTESKWLVKANLALDAAPTKLGEHFYGGGEENLPWTVHSGSSWMKCSRELYDSLGAIPAAPATILSPIEVLKAYYVGKEVLVDGIWHDITDVCIEFDQDISWIRLVYAGSTFNDGMIDSGEEYSNRYGVLPIREVGSHA